jgi:hypothetical protein
VLPELDPEEPELEPEEDDEDELELPPSDWGWAAPTRTSSP